MITNDVKYVGVKDLKIDLFEGQYKVPDGMTYNSYVIMDDKICVLDTVDKNYKEEWLDNLAKVLGDKKPDYLLVHHMEPDHSANIDSFMEKYPDAIIVSSIGAFNMMKNLFGKDYNLRRIVVKEGDTLSLGRHTLTFIAAPLVHWPEVIFSYDSYDKILFSADGFGKFGSSMDESDWLNEARRYYFGIVGKFGQNVTNVLNKASSLDIKIICPLHGPILKENLGYYLNLYKTWSSYEPEANGVCICYCSVYQNTEKACKYLYDKLKEENTNVEIFDLARTEGSYVLEGAFKYSKLVLASPTYNGDIFPYMKEFIHHLIDHNYQKRDVALIENGMWAPMANKNMKLLLDNLKDINIIDTITIKGMVSEDVKNKLNDLTLKLK